MQTIKINETNSGAIWNTQNENITLQWLVRDLIQVSQCVYRCVCESMCVRASGVRYCDSGRNRYWIKLTWAGKYFRKSSTKDWWNDIDGDVTVTKSKNDERGGADGVKYPEGLPSVQSNTHYNAYNRFVVVLAHIHELNHRLQWTYIGIALDRQTPWDRPLVCVAIGDAVTKKLNQVWD